MYVREKTEKAIRRVYPRYRRDAGMLKTELCACALEPVPNITVCDSGIGFLFLLFLPTAVGKKGGDKSCKIIKKARRIS